MPGLAHTAYSMSFIVLNWSRYGTHPEYHPGHIMQGLANTVKCTNIPEMAHIRHHVGPIRKDLADLGNSKCTRRPELAHIWPHVGQT